MTHTKKVPAPKYKKLADRKKVIHFTNRTYEYIQLAFMRLKTRYKYAVALGKLTLIRGLYSGSFEVC